MSSDLASRYGTGRKRRLPIVVAGAVAIVLLAWLVWAIWGQSDPKVTSALVSFDVSNPHAAVAHIDVHLQSTDVHATCKIQATASDHTIVGERHLAVPRDQGRDVTLHLRIRTERQATSVELTGCTAPGQKHAR